MLLHPCLAAAKASICLGLSEYEAILKVPSRACRLGKEYGSTISAAGVGKVGAREVEALA